MRRSGAVLAAGAAGAACVALLAGCGDDYPSYPNSLACSVPASTITDVLGTDHFHTVTKGVRLPLTSQAFFDCMVGTSKEHSSVISITALKLSPDDQASRRKQIAATDEQLSVGRASVGVKVTDEGFTGYALCGPVAATVQASPDRKVSASERTALVKAVAAVAGCG